MALSLTLSFLCFTHSISTTAASLNKILTVGDAYETFIQDENQYYIW